MHGCNAASACVQLRICRIKGGGGGKGTHFIITTSTPCRIQAMIHRGLGFCTIVEVVLLYQPTVKVFLSVSCGEYQNPSRLHDAISGQNGGCMG